MRASHPDNPILGKARHLPAEATDARFSSSPSASDRAGKEAATCLLARRSEIEEANDLLTNLRIPVEAENASRDDYLALQICSEAWQLQLTTQVYFCCLFRIPCRSIQLQD